MVKDGGGIEPDVKTTARKYSKITQSLLNKNLIFDFATQYRIKHPTIPDPEEFNLTQNDFNDFIDFIKDKDYNYTTKSEEVLKQFKETLIQEKYIDTALTYYNHIESKLQSNKKDDLITHKDEIMEVLSQEIVSRYYFQKGRIKNNIKKDAEIKKALEILNDKKQYNQLLAPEANLYKVEENKN
jgi:carboxyl-terminal processing protease